MTESRRIFYNIIATYSRSLYALVIGLFTARWVLAALGTSDYGLYGVIGGLVVFVTFINGLLQVAVVRYYGVSVGKEQSALDKREAIDECRKWFNSALLIYIVIPILLLVIGYPIGQWAIRSFLVIPAERVAVCIVVWRYTCLSCFIVMCSVPFQAMYTAKQEIAELTIYNFATTTINACFFYYMVLHPRDWLSDYALWMCLSHVLPQVLISVRALQKYEECKFVLRYLFDLSRIKSIFGFASARLITAISSIFFNQGQNILANRFFGPTFNASMSIGNAVSSQAATLSTSISGAFWPAIANAAGAGDFEKVKRLSFMTCRLGSALILVFVIPLSLEIKIVLDLWLKAPPPFSAQLCVAILLAYAVERSTEGYWMAIFAKGARVAYYSAIVGWSGLIGFCIALGCLLLGLGRWSICIGYLSSKILTVVLRLWLGRTLMALSISSWLEKVAFPLLKITCLCYCVGLLPYCLIERGLFRLFVVFSLIGISFLLLFWCLVLEDFEKKFVAKKIIHILTQKGGNNGFGEKG